MPVSRRIFLTSTVVAALPRICSAAVRYKAARTEQLKRDLRWQMENNRGSLEAMTRASRTRYNSHLINSGWEMAAWQLLNGQRHNPDAMKTYLRYFPFCLRYGASLVQSTVASLPDPEFVFPPKYSPDALDEVRRHLVWQYENNSDSLKDALNRYASNEWHEGTKELLHGQSGNADAQILYLRYFPEVVRYTAWKFNRLTTLPDPELENA